MRSVLYIPTLLLETLTPDEMRRLTDHLFEMRRLEDNLFMKGGEHDMKAKSKGLTKNQKLKKLKTSKAKKLVKSKKK